MTLLTAPK